MHDKKDMKQNKVTVTKKDSSIDKRYPKNERDVIVSSVAPKHQGRDKVEKIV